MIRVIWSYCLVLLQPLFWLHVSTCNLSAKTIPNNLLFEKIYFKEKTPFGIVEDLQQDAQGFIWIGAKDGLFRYDGCQFKEYQHDRADTNSLSSNVVREIFIDSRNNMWIGTENGLNLFQPRTDNFKRFFNDPDNTESISGNNIRKISEDQSGYLWIATIGGGVCRFDYESYSFTNIFEIMQAGNSGYPVDARTVYTGSDGTVWIGSTNNGIQYFLPGENRLSQLPVTLPDGRYPDVRAIIEGPDGKLWIGTNGNGIISYDKISRKYFFYHTRSIPSKGISNDVIWNLFYDSNDILWACSDGGGLMRYNHSNDLFLNYVYDESEPTGISSNVVRVIFEDSAGNYWIGNFNAPINYVNNNRKQFNLLRNIDHKHHPDQNKITSIFVDSKENLWICTDGAGIFVKDHSSGSYKNFKAANGLPNDKPLSIAEDKNGNIWIGFYERGLCRYNKNTNKITSFYPDGSSKMPESKQVWDLLVDSNKLWIAGEQGVEYYDFQTGNFNFSPFPEKNEIIFSAWNLMMDDEKFLWMGTINGLFIYNQNNNTIEHYFADESNLKSLSDNWIFTIHKDTENRIWIGTNGGGLNLWKGNGEFQSFTDRNGLSGNVINSIESDSSGNLWIATNNGLTRFNYDSLSFRNFSTDDGLQDDRFNINACFNKNGYLYFGGINGITFFRPEEITDNTFIPPVVFTELELYHQSSSGDSKLPLKRNILYEKVIHIYPGQMIFTVYFAALNYSNPERNQYRYKLDDLDTYWNDVGNHNWATFTGLKPGRYKLSVIATNDDHVWNTKGNSIQIFVHPPFYRSNWFLILLVSLIVFLAVIIYRQRIRNVKQINSRLAELVHERTRELEERNKEIEKQNEEIIRQRDIANNQRDQIQRQNLELEEHRSRLEELVEERTHDLVLAKEAAEEGDKLKTAFLENLSYQIRTPMNAIIGFVNLLSDKIDDTTSRDYYIRIIKDSGRSMLRLIEDIVDYSQMQIGQLKPEYNECNVGETIRQLVSTTRERASREKPSLSIMAEIPEPDFNMYTDEKKLTQIFSKLIENSLKFTEKGYIKIGIYKREKDFITFFVEDTGVGIEKKYWEKIFDRLFTAEQDAENYRGSGIGLAFAKLATQTLGGQIWVNSKVSSGSTFYFSLPYVSAPASSAEKITSGAKKYYWPGKTILIAEDEDSNFLLIEAILRDTGVKLVRALNGFELLEKISDGDNYDLVLLDLKMPRMGGIHAMKIIREGNSEIPVIVQTAYDQASQREQCKELGCNEFLVKPLRKLELLEMIRKYLQ